MENEEAKELCCVCEKKIISNDMATCIICNKWICAECNSVERLIEKCITTNCGNRVCYDCSCAGSCSEECRIMYLEQKKEDTENRIQHIIIEHAKQIIILAEDIEDINSEIKELNNTGQ